MPSRIAMQPLVFCIGVLWASPSSLLGLIAGTLALASGGRVQRHGPALEFSGGFARWLLQRMPITGGAGAMTLGHVILGQSVADLNSARLHEWVHVRQYQRWGPLFLPAYLGCSLVLWLRGRDFYRDNPFEIEAYRQAP